MKRMHLVGKQHTFTVKLGEDEAQPLFSVIWYVIRKLLI